MIHVGPTSEAVALWSGTLDALSSRVSARSRAALCDATRCLELRGSSLRVAARSGPLPGWVRSGTVALLDQALDTLSEGSVALALVPVDPGAPLDRDPRLDLGSFITSPANAPTRDALRSFVNDARGPARVLIGPSGSGKTHLLRAAAARLGAPCHPAEALSMQVVQAIWDEDLDGLRERLRGSAALVVDGIEALEGREATQEELATALLDLDARSVPVLLSSARPPAKLSLESPGLRERLERADPVELAAPGWETRVAIILDRIRGWGVETSPEVASLLAGRLRSQLERLDTTLTSLLARCAGNAELTDADLVRQLVDGGARRSIRVSADEVIALVARHFDVRLRDLRSPSRSPRVTTPRQIAMYLVRRHCGLSYPEIGRRFDRHHTTAIHSDRLVQKQLEQNGSLRSAVVLLEKELLQLSSPASPDPEEGG